MSTSKDLVIAKLQKLNEQKDIMIMQLAEETEALNSLVKAVRNTLRDFKRQSAGKQVDLFFDKLGKLSNDYDKVKKEILSCIIAQRSTTAGLSRVVYSYANKQHMVLPSGVGLMTYPDITFEAIHDNAQKDPNMALSVLTAMLVVLLEIEEEKMEQMAKLEE
jgi:hypothetical protein